MHHFVLMVPCLLMAHTGYLFINVDEVVSDLILLVFLTSCDRDSDERNKAIRGMCIPLATFISVLTQPLISIRRHVASCGIALLGK